MIIINDEILQEIINIELGLFAPLKGFMNSKDYRSVVDNNMLSNGEVFTLPITLDIDKETYKNILYKDKAKIYFNRKYVADIEIDDIYKIKEEDIFKIFKTNDLNHPGVKKEVNRNIFRVGGKVKLVDKNLLKNNLNPQKTKKLFSKYKMIAGFQTRNIPHRAHEYLHRLALEFCDALFINPLVGWKKRGDFTQQAVEVGYKALIDNYYNGLNVYFDTLKTPMRYAGPREAVFHAIIRKNLGCTHFIIGRDHAGVGKYYGKYEAQEFALSFNNLGIEILAFKEPFYCNKCKMIVSEKTCSHKNINKISGTLIREMLQNNKFPPEELLRNEVAKEILKLKKVFI